MEQKRLICLVGWEKNQLARLLAVTNNAFAFSEAKSETDFCDERAANLDVILVLTPDEHFNPLPLIDLARHKAPFAQIAFFGPDQALRQIRQRLILVRALGHQWTFLKDEQPETWMAGLADACSSTLKRRSITAVSPLKQMPPVRESKPSTAATPLSENQQHAYFSSIVRHAREAILFLDLRGKIVFWNRAAEQMYGFPAEGVTGKNIKELVMPSFYEKHERVIEDVITNKGDFLLQLEHMTPDGRSIAVEESLAPVKDWRGVITGVMVIVRDISERLEKERLARERIVQEQARAVMAAANADLERRVAERTAELRSLNQELESFSYSVSHDLRTPLRAINSFSQVLQDKYVSVLDEQGQYYFSRICAAAQRMSELIDDILLLARVTRVEMYRKPVNLSAIAFSVIAYLREAYMQYRHIEFAVEPDLIVDGDEKLLQIVLENLLSNAAKFAHKNPQAKVFLGLERQDSRNIYFVQDNGVGFEMQYVKKLFTPFQRLHGINEFEGTGIGLATVRRIIERHGGQVWAEGQPNHGACFFFTLDGSGKNSSHGG